MKYLIVIAALLLPSLAFAAPPTTPAGTTGCTSVTSTSTKVLSINLVRQTFLCADTQTSDPNTYCIVSGTAGGSVTAPNGYLIQPGGYWEEPSAPGVPVFKGEIDCATSSGTSTICCTEY